MSLTIATAALALAITGVGEDSNRFGVTDDQQHIITNNKIASVVIPPQVSDVFIETIQLHEIDNEAIEEIAATIQEVKATPAKAKKRIKKRTKKPVRTTKPITNCN